MTVEEYRSLPEEGQKRLLIDANKVAEHEDEIATYELFRIDDFYVEVSRSVTYRFRKILNTYSHNNLPPNYVLKDQVY